MLKYNMVVSPLTWYIYHVHREVMWSMYHINRDRDWGHNYYQLIAEETVYTETSIYAAEIDIKKEIILR